MPIRRIQSRIFLAALLVLHAAMLAWSATRHSPTYDEVAWLPAGLSHWELGRFDLARVNPPLVRTIAAIPVAFAAHQSDWTNYAVYPGGRPEFQVGVDFMRANGARSFWLFTLARWACIPFSILGGYICYRWASDLYGPMAGCLSATLWCFCPNVLGHGELITSDVAATSLGGAACYAFWRWLQQPKFDAVLLSGLLLGLAELTKTTWLLLFALWPIAWLSWRFSNRHDRLGQHSEKTGGCWRSVSRAPAHRSLAVEIGGLVGMAATALLVLNLGYAFEGSFRPLGDYPFVSHALTIEDGGQPQSGVNRFRRTWLNGLPVPLPESYLLGIDQTKAEFEQGKRSYLGGQWKHGGWWYYYLYGLALKVPIGTWLLGLIAVAVTALSPRYRQRWRDEVVLLSPAAAVLLLVSLQTGFNSHLRYVLPVFPFVFIWLGKLMAPDAASGTATDYSPAHSKAMRNRGGAARLPRWRFGLLSSQPARELVRRQVNKGNVVPWVSGVALLGTLASAIGAYPHSLAYFNAFGGGWRNGHAHLLDSNIDWGQDLLYLRNWLDDHPEARPLGLAYFGLTDPKLAKIDFTLPPKLLTRPQGFDGRLEDGLPRPSSTTTDGLGRPSSKSDVAIEGAPTPMGNAEGGPRPGWYAISVNFLRGYKIPAFDGFGGQKGIAGPWYTYFLNFEPIAVAGRSIYIYHITREQANRLRSQLGLPAAEE